MLASKFTSPSLLKALKTVAANGVTVLLTEIFACAAKAGRMAALAILTSFDIGKLVKVDAVVSMNPKVSISVRRT